MEIFSKKLTKTDVENRLCMNSKSLVFFPPFEGGQHAQVLRVEDEEGEEWRFRLTIRRGRYRKPVLSAADWLRFVRSKKLESGFKVQLFKKQNEATGEVKYKIKLEKPILLFKTVLYAPYLSTPKD